MTIPFVIRAAESVMISRVAMIITLKEVTRHNVRLYAKEGKPLSHKSNSRMTWYTNLLTAIECGDYLGGETGQMVYVDLELDILSSYSVRFYKLGDEAYTIHNDLMKLVKRKWKYVRA